MNRRTAWVHADEAKGGEAIGVPLNDDAVAVLRAELGKHPLRVFTFKGKPLGQANTRAWRNALKRAGIRNFRWHDLRHVWATWHVMAGTTMAELQELGGWKSGQMVRRHAHLAPGAIAGGGRINWLHFHIHPPKSELREATQAIEYWLPDQGSNLGPAGLTVRSFSIELPTPIDWLRIFGSVRVPALSASYYLDGEIRTGNRAQVPEPSSYWEITGTWCRYSASTALIFATSARSLQAKATR